MERAKRKQNGKGQRIFIMGDAVVKSKREKDDLI